MTTRVALVRGARLACCVGLIALAAATAGCADSGSSAGQTSTAESGGSTSTSMSTSTSTGHGGAGAGGGAGGGACPSCSDPETPGTLANAAITEASGIVASKLHPGDFYVHNDSGDTARFFAIDGAGADLGAYDVTGATAIDWEDVTRGACADATKSCLFLADIGDNSLARTEYVVYRVEEPAALAPGTHAVTADALRFTYPDGAHNAEAISFDPNTGALVIITKNANVSRIYAISPPFDATRTVTATLLGTASVPDILPLVTASDISQDGSQILVRTYASVWRYPRTNGEPIETALAKTPCLLSTPTESQGEAIAWKLDAAGFVTVSEGVAPELHAVSCR
ncbi:MAG TPA: hypothetical protein VL400_22420 [Polyangiaceae bacterium]|nr:hypothetical protein [Polyangiaceae bacterium]